MIRKLAVAMGVVMHVAAFTWHLGEKVHTLKFFLEAPHDPVVRQVLAAIPTGAAGGVIALVALVVALAAFMRKGPEKSPRAESDVPAKRARGIKVVEEREEIHRTRIVKSISDDDVE